MKNINFELLILTIILVLMLGWGAWLFITRAKIAFIFDLFLSVI